MYLKFVLGSCLFAILVVTAGCTANKELGTKKHPLKILLVPSQDTKTLGDNAKLLQKYLNQDLKMEVSIEVASSYIAVVEAFGSKRVDVAFINTFGYILANEKYNVEAKLRFVSQGRDEYNGQIIARVDGPQKIQDLNGKNFAFVDPSSSSGYLLPSHLFKKQNINLKQTLFAGRHDSVVTAVYQRKVDAGATFYALPDKDGTPKDARMLVKAQFPDVFDKIKILKLTGPIPNDPVIFRKDLTDDLKNKIVNSLIKYIHTADGQVTLYNLYHIEDFKVTTDSDYNNVRSYLKELGRNIQDFVR